jgi:hypothetical protein
LNRTYLTIFQVMRFQIDEHREELKKQIDVIALEMIDETKKHEAMYLNSLKRDLFKTLHFDQTKSLETELNQIEEVFRNPNLLMETIQEMQLKQEESLKDIQSILNQMNQVKGNLKASNGFIPNLSLFDQKETCLFGSDGDWLNVKSLKSQILKGEKQCFELLEVCEFSPSDKWSLLYRVTRDGFRPRDFHSKCDGHSNTLTIFKAKESKFIFGGFTSVSWDSSINWKWKSDANAFIFSLTNNDNKPLKMKIDPDKHRYAIYCNFEYGPTFGTGIRIKNNAKTTMDSYSNLGKSYKHPQYAEGTNEARTFLAGSIHFRLDEIEVYGKE